MKRIILLGATGSVGTGACDVVRAHPDEFKVVALAARSNRAAVESLAVAFGARAYVGEDAALLAVEENDADIVFVATVGLSGLAPTLAAIEKGITVALATKEVLVAAGALVMARAREKGVRIIPVDSEHSAIFQCLQAAGGNKPEKILLTASGGPFRTWEKARIEKATRAEALKHPNWNMGAKITVDSASMFNKGLEIMEARWLFDMTEDRIEVVVHPQSIVHSAIVFRDGAVLAQLGEPDMRVPIGYAMAFPERIETGVPAPDLFALGSLTFEKPDEEKFPALRMARECLRAGGAACTVFNGANEEAVAAFLREEIPFGEIAVRVERALDKLAGLPADCIEDIWKADRLAREAARA